MDEWVATVVALVGAMIVYWIQEKPGYNHWVEQTVNRLFGKKTEQPSKAQPQKAKQGLK